MHAKGRTPPRDGEYKEDSARLARTQTDGDIVTISNVRDSFFPGIDQREVRWTDLTVDAREITNLWVYFCYFGAFRGVAHSEIGFEFADHRCLTMSFEIRPLAHQSYTIVDGMKRTFEMSMRWTTERDAVLRRTYRTKVEYQVRMFEAAITQPRTVELFHAAAQRTNTLAENPEWYNTVTNSCTTSLVGLVGEVLPNQLRSTPRILLPGLLPKYWAKHGVLAFEGSFSDAFAAACINDRAIEIGYVDDFSARLHGRA